MIIPLSTRMSQSCRHVDGQIWREIPTSPYCHKSLLYMFRHTRSVETMSQYHNVDTMSVGPYNRWEAKSEPAGDTHTGQCTRPPYELAMAKKKGACSKKVRLHRPAPSLHHCL